MSLNINKQSITDQLSQALKKMRDFLLANPSDEDYYKTLYNTIEKLNISAKTEGWFNYEHKNSHRTLREFLDNKNVSELIIKYYSIPSSWSRKLINSSKEESKREKIKKSFEWVFDQIGKVKPDIKL